jgi:uncharacterized protein (DUF362 family)
MASSLENVVAVARTKPSYGDWVSAGGTATCADAAVQELFRTWGLDMPHYGTAAWNPLAAFIPPGSRVVLKPNWVFHRNASGAGLDCLITHSSVIEAVAKYVSLTRPAQLTIGDAPIQGCDFEQLRELGGINTFARRLENRGLQFTISDFRRTILRGNSLGNAKSENVRDLEKFTLFDLGKDSLLHRLNGDAHKFRVTMYNPDFLLSTHGGGRHQYLIAREVLDADVVVNLPKLKCHRKACVTGALKNLIGINGNKEYLPHHRKGGSENGGDCYAGRPLWKRATEDLLDAANRRPAGISQAALAWMAGTAQRIAAKLGSDENIEGSWHGNDTIWRTCLDLQRILRYGRGDGRLASNPQRIVISITDAIIAGEGEGPLANTPVPSGFLTGALNPAAAEWIHARLMGFDPNKIPLIRESFGNFQYPLADFSTESIQVWIAGSEKEVHEIFPFEGRAFVPPRGWQGYCELRENGFEPHTHSTKPQYVPVQE